MNGNKPNVGAGRSFAVLFVVLWAAALVFYFQHKEGLINAPGLDKPAHAHWFDPRPEPAEHRGVYATILRNVPGEYRIWWDNIPYADIAWALVPILLYFLIGWVLVDAFDAYFPSGAHACLALAVGAGTAGVAFEFLTMLGLLSRWPVVVVWIALFLLVFSVRNYRLLGRKPIPQDNPIPPLELRREAAKEWRIQSVLRPFGWCGHIYFYAAALLIAVISLLVFVHAVTEPETYWDSLILYMGYARKIFLTGGFPLKVTGQVGIGLGANYPHLYPLLTAQTSALAGHWNDIHAQFLPPLASFATTMLVYYTAEELSRDKLVAISAALLFRSIPYGIAYGQYASDYAIAIFFTAAFLYCSLKYISDGLRGYFALALLIAAYSVHINYLMWVLWIAAGAVFVAAHWKWSEFPEAFEETEESFHNELRAPDYIVVRHRASVMAALSRRGLWIMAGICFLVAIPWYVRNTIVTHNPVYAFYNNIFPGIKVNPEVMRSATQEWLLNGDGVGRVGHTLLEKVLNSWLFFVTGSQHWKLAPVFVAFAVPGFVIFLAQTSGAFRKRFADARIRFGAAASVLFLLLWFYEYCVADFYLYQIIIVLPLFAIYACYVFDFCAAKWARRCLFALCILVGFSPGVISGLMGWKLKNTGVYTGIYPPQISLRPLKNLFMDRDTYYRMEYGGDMEMFGRVNALPNNTKVLTHENRHLLLDERIQIIHLDDWDVQKAYRKAAADRVKILDGLGITYYWYMPNEDKHATNALLGMEELIELGYFKEIYRSPSSGHSTPEVSPHRVIPADMNVLYKRTDKAD